MDFLTSAFEAFLHIDRHLLDLSMTYGAWIYAILFLIVFFETGVVVTPFLPGDSLLFATGALAAAGVLDIGTVLVLGVHLLDRFAREQARETLRHQTLLPYPSSSAALGFPCRHPGFRRSPIGPSILRSRSGPATKR